MGHKCLTTAAWLAIASLGAACSGDDSSNQNTSPQEESGRGGSGGVKASTTSGRGGTGGTNTAGSGSLPRNTAGDSATAGSSSSAQPLAGSGVPAAGRAAPTLNTAGAAAAGTSAGAGRGGANAQAGAGGAQAVMLSDAQIASVLLTADEGEVQQNTLAASKAIAPAARAFAQDLVNMHRAAASRLTTLLTTLNLNAQGNTVTDSLRKDSERIVAKLQDEPSVTFDMAYLQSQIDVHIKVLNLIDQTLLPSAKNEQLRNEIAVVRGEVALHLARARMLAETLNLDVDAGVGGDLDAG